MDPETPLGQDARLVDLSETDEGAEAPGQDSSKTRSWVDPLRWGLLSWLLTRVGATAGSWIAIGWMRVGETVAVPSYTPPGESGPLTHLLVRPWLRADALWYLKIATVGYRHDGRSIEFFPIFPWIVRLIRPVFGGDEVIAGLVVANLCAIAGLVLLYTLVREVADAGAARTTVLGLAVFPTAFWFVAPYAEPVMLMMMCAAAVAVVRRKDGLALTLGFIAGLTRPTAIVVAALLFALGWRYRGTVRRALVVAAGPVAGFGTWFVASAVITAHRMALIDNAAQYWQRKPGFFAFTLVKGIRAWWGYKGTEFGPYFLIDIVSVSAGIALVAASLIYMRKRGAGMLGWGFAGFGALALIMPLSSVFDPRPFLSMPRHILVMTPLWIGYCVVPRRARIPLGVVSFAGLVLTTALYVAARPIF